MSSRIFFYDTMLGVFPDLLLSNGKKGYKFVGEAMLLRHKLAFCRPVSYGTDEMDGKCAVATIVPVFDEEDSVVNGIILDVKDSMLDLLSTLYPEDTYVLVSKKFFVVSKKGKLKKIRADVYVLKSPTLEGSPLSEYLKGMRDGYKVFDFSTSVIDDILVPLLIVEKKRVEDSSKALLEYLGYGSLEDLMIKGIFGNDRGFTNHHIEDDGLELQVEDDAFDKKGSNNSDSIFDKIESCAEESSSHKSDGIEKVEHGVIIDEYRGVAETWSVEKKKDFSKMSIRVFLKKYYDISLEYDNTNGFSESLVSVVFHWSPSLKKDFLSLSRDVFLSKYPLVNKRDYVIAYLALEHLK